MISPRALFGIAVRILGIWFLTQCAYYLFWTALKSSALDTGNPAITRQEDVAFATYYLLLGLFLLMGARFFVWLGYGDAPKRPSDDVSQDASPPL